MREHSEFIEERQLPPWLHPTISKFDARYDSPPLLVCHRDIAREYMSCAVHLSSRNADKSILEQYFSVDDEGGRSRIRRKSAARERGKETYADNNKSEDKQVAKEHTSGLKCATSTALPSRPKLELSCACIKSSCVDVCPKAVDLFAPKSLSSAAENDRDTKAHVYLNRTETETLMNIEILTKSSRPLPRIPCQRGADSTSVISQENVTKTYTVHASQTTFSSRKSKSRKSADEISSIVKECRKIGDDLRTLRWSVLTSLDKSKEEQVQFNVIDCIIKAQFNKVLKTLRKTRTLYEEACHSCGNFKPGKASFHSGFYCNRLAFVSTTKQVDELRFLMKNDLTGMQKRLFLNDEDLEIGAIFQHIVVLLDLVDAITTLRLFVTHIKNAVQQETENNIKILVNISAIESLKTKVLAKCVGMKIQKYGKGILNPSSGITKDGCVHVSAIPVSQQWSTSPDRTHGSVSAIRHLEAHMESSLDNAHMEPYGERRAKLAQRDCRIL
ncbi:uncharacterized protein LOC127871724 [Dreissena polymorpha]|uniref:Uncharacterized protein n=1 Tax=Dreissena polymorpha TaxID=45954 RepID=A0A9D4R999_DREPO|nr:uncharacterized protein LOC127871724 [Dreissena polymorpha]KAH3858973.1 hypothetical protein DPMN_101619 [Dreissena polymorpha]